MCAQSGCITSRPLLRKALGNKQKNELIRRSGKDGKKETNICILASKGNLNYLSLLDLVDLSGFTLGISPGYNSITGVVDLFVPLTPLHSQNAFLLLCGPKPLLQG